MKLLELLSAVKQIAVGDFSLILSVLEFLAQVRGLSNKIGGLVAHVLTDESVISRGKGHGVVKLSGTTAVSKLSIQLANHVTTYW